ncbi:hypothetical protein [Mycobacterium intracellulare]|uniref:hypothetical protein n=1 Tax=Mycobacterium intracellulare TaxID=1767 RepID=UPI001E4C9DA4|nr:hypothetical protein [Mycobacterium intracellulare]
MQRIELGLKLGIAAGLFNTGDTVGAARHDDIGRGLGFDAQQQEICRRQSRQCVEQRGVVVLAGLDSPGLVRVGVDAAKQVIRPHRAIFVVEDQISGASADPGIVVRHRLSPSGVIDRRPQSGSQNQPQLGDFMQHTLGIHAVDPSDSVHDSES